MLLLFLPKILQGNFRIQVDLSNVCALNFWCHFIKLMNKRRVCFIGIENKIITMNYNVFLQYEINSFQHPFLLTFLLFSSTAPY